MTNNNNSKIKTDLKIRSYNFSKDIIRFLDKNSNIGQILINQLLRSSTSIGANIVEGKCSISRREFIKYLQIALKSANETLYWLCLIRDTKNIDVRNLIDECQQLAKLLASSLITLKGKRKI